MITAPFAISKPTLTTAAATFGLLAALALAAPGLSGQRPSSMPHASAPGALRAVERAMRLGDRLELTQEQREQLEAMRAGIVEQRADLSARIMRLASEVRAGLGEAGAVREALAAVRKEARAGRREFRGRYGEIFTDEQKRQLRRLDRRWAWRQRGARGGGHPGWDRRRGVRGRGAIERGRGGDRFPGRRPPRGPGG